MKLVEELLQKFSNKESSLVDSLKEDEEELIKIQIEAAKKMLRPMMHLAARRLTHMVFLLELEDDQLVWGVKGRGHLKNPSYWELWDYIVDQGLTPGIIKRAISLGGYLQESSWLAVEMPFEVHPDGIRHKHGIDNRNKAA